MPRGSRLRIYAGGPPDDAAPHAKPKSAQNSGATVEKVAASRGSGTGEQIEHHVKRGETLYSIAREYGTTVASLRQSNPFLAGRSLIAGDVLKINR